MGDVADVTITTPPTGPDAPQTGAERPAHVPEKFWDAETGSIKTDALLQSYAHLESKLGGGNPADEAGNEGAQEGSDEGTDEGTGEDDPEGDKAREVAEEAGLDIQALEAHWEEHGSLPEDTYEKLASVGVDKSLVDEFVAYRIAQGAAVRDEMYATVGGEEVVNKMVDWAAKNWTQEQADAFNEAVNSKRRGKIEIALKGLKADYDKANGVKPKLLKSTNSATVKGDRYESLEEMLADQRNPKYRSDPAFRQRVIDKLSRSNI